VRVKEDLARYEPLLYIPTKCIISTEHARQSPIGHLFESHEALFVTNYDRDNNMLLVYLIYERLKAAESFYHPYFEMVDSPTPTVYWPEQVLGKCDLKITKDQLRDGKKRADEQWDKLRLFFEIYPD